MFDQRMASNFAIANRSAKNNMLNITRQSFGKHVAINAVR